MPKIIVPYVSSNVRNQKFLTRSFYEENDIPILQLFDEISKLKCDFECNHKVKDPIYMQEHNFLELFKLNVFLLNRLLVKQIHIQPMTFFLGIIKFFIF